MWNVNDFAASQADRDQQMQFSAQQREARAQAESGRVGPVFGPLLARLGEGMIAAGTRLHERYAEIQAEEAAAPSPKGWAIPQA